VLLIKLIRLEIHFLVQFQSNNMKLLNYKPILFIFSLILIMSCDPGGDPIGCTDETRETFTMPTILEDYFGVYQEGNWWVYYNEDSTKVDSLFVTNYEDEIVAAEFECEQSISNNYQINATYLTPNNIPFVGKNSGSNCCVWDVLWNYKDQKGFSLSTTGNEDSLSLFLYSPFHEQIDSLKINTINYYDVIVMQTTNSGDKVFFVKNIGLIRFELDNETFNLTKYEIQ
jgi:hypothetical protein